MPIVSDDFAGTGALSANWTVAIGSLSRNADALAGGTADYNIAWWDGSDLGGHTFDPDQFSEITMGTYGASSYGALAVRCSGSGGTRTMYVYSFSQAAANADVFRVVNNVSTKIRDLAESFGTPSPNDIVRMEVEGQWNGSTGPVIRIYWDSVDGSTLRFTTNDDNSASASVSGGAPGVGTFRADSRILDWEGGDDAVVPPSTVEAGLRSRRKIHFGSGLFHFLRFRRSKRDTTILASGGTLQVLGGHSISAEEFFHASGLNPFVALAGLLIRNEEMSNPGNLAPSVPLAGDSAGSEEDVRAGAIAPDVILSGADTPTEEQSNPGTLNPSVILSGAFAGSEEDFRAGTLLPTIQIAGDFIPSEEAFHLHSIAAGVILGGEHLSPEEKMNASTVLLAGAINGSFIASEEVVRPGTLAPRVTVTGVFISSEEAFRAGAVDYILALGGAHILSEEQVRGGIAAMTVALAGAPALSEERVFAGALSNAIRLGGVNIPSEEKMHQAALDAIVSLQGVYIPAEEKVHIGVVSLLGDITLFGVFIHGEELVRTGLIVGGVQVASADIIEANSDFESVLEADSEFAR